MRVPDGGQYILRESVRVPLNKLISSLRIDEVDCRIRECHRPVPALYLIERREPDHPPAAVLAVGLDSQFASGNMIYAVKRLAESVAADHEVTSPIGQPRRRAHRGEPLSDGSR
jgi:hypothetical protein